MNEQALLEVFSQLGERERRIVGELMRRKPVTRDVNAEISEHLTFGQRTADRVASFGGSWRFIFLFLASMGTWIVWNVRSGQAFDPYPFILLNLILSCIAALQAPVIMMSQNRQAERDRLDAHNDYDVNLKAELEILALHAKLDELRQERWQDLIELQQRQLAILERLAETPTKSQ